MLKDTVAKLENAIRQIRSLGSPDKTALLTLLAELQTEVQKLSKTNQEQAHSIASLADLAAHEATRRTKSPDLLQHSVAGLALSAQGFEASHPQLVDTVNRVCTMLARIGI